jgi:hypothetical protein
LTSLGESWEKVKSAAWQLGRGLSHVFWALLRLAFLLPALLGAVLCVSCLWMETALGDEVPSLLPVKLRQKGQA